MQTRIQNQEARKTDGVFVFKELQTARRAAEPACIRLRIYGHNKYLPTNERFIRLVRDDESRTLRAGMSRVRLMKTSKPGT